MRRCTEIVESTRSEEAMSPPAAREAADTGVSPTRRRELVMFLLLAFGVWPVVAVGVVGGYGFLVWMWQLISGPPGPPGG
jgi:nitrate reductase NapE